MLKASSNICSKVIAELTNSIISDNTMPNKWNDSILSYTPICNNCPNLQYKGKGEALDRENYWGLKLTEHILKVIK